MAEKYELGHFGHCPRVFCHGAKVLPVGCSDIPGQETVKLFCPSCLDVYTPPNSRFQTVDGAFFGTTFGCLFFMTFPELDVGGTRPAPPVEASSASPAAAQSSKNRQSSLSSSITAEQFQSGVAPPPPEPAPLPKQPDSINGVTPKNLAPGLGQGFIYEPRIYGFRVSEIAKTGPRMKWLRSRPGDVNELDECRIWAQNQEALLASQGPVTDEGIPGPPIDDSEMADLNEERDDGEVEDQEMNGDGVVDEVKEQKRKSKRRGEVSAPGMVNGDTQTTRSAVRVGGGG